MRRTRLTAAGAAAVIALGGTIAAAEESTADTAAQTLTITVEAAARSITVGDPAGTLSVAVGANADALTTSTLAYNAGEAAGAKITAEVTDVTPGTGAAGADWEDALGELTLGVEASEMDGDAGTAASALLFSKTNVAVGDLVTGIAANEVVTGKTITYALGGTAPSTPVEDASVQITFTIKDNDA